MIDLQDITLGLEFIQEQYNLNLLYLQTSADQLTEEQRYSIEKPLTTLLEQAQTEYNVMPVFDPKTGEIVMWMPHIYVIPGQDLEEYPADS